MLHPIREPSKEHLDTKLVPSLSAAYPLTILSLSLSAPQSAQLPITFRGGETCWHHQFYLVLHPIRDTSKEQLQNQRSSWTRNSFRPYLLPIRSASAPYPLPIPIRPPFRSAPNHVQGGGCVGTTSSTSCCIQSVTHQRSRRT